MAEENSDTKKDRFYLTFITFYSMGTLTQLPAQFITTDKIYWNYKFRDVDKPWNATSDDTNAHQNGFNSNCVSVSSASIVLGLIIVILFAKHWNLTYRTIGCFCGYIVTFLLIVLFAVIDTDSWNGAFYYLMLSINFIIGFFTAMLYVTIFQLGSKFPPVYLAAALSGQAICGIFSACVQILVLFVDGTPETNGLLFFSIAVICISLTLITFLVTIKISEFFKYHMEKKEPKANDEKISISKEFIYSIIRRQKFVYGAIGILTGISMMLQPGITSTIKSVDAGNGSKWNDTFFVPVTTFLAYNVFDLTGRELAVRIEKPKNDAIIFVIALLRIAIVPLILMCNLDAKKHTAVLFRSDVIYIILLIIFAISSGYNTNMCILNLPRNFVNTGAERTIAVILLVFVIIVSTVLFSIVGSAIIKIL